MTTIERLKQKRRILEDNRLLNNSIKLNNRKSTRGRKYKYQYFDDYSIKHIHQSEKRLRCAPKMLERFEAQMKKSHAVDLFPKEESKEWSEFKEKRRIAKKLLKQRLKGKMFHDSSKGTYIRTTKRRFEK